MASTFCSGFNSARTSSSFNCSRKMFRRRLAVAGQNHRAQTFVPQFLNDAGGLRADVVAQNDAAQQIAALDPDLGKTGVR